MDLVTNEIFNAAACGEKVGCSVQANGPFHVQRIVMIYLE